MKYFEVLFLIVLSIYPFSYAKYNLSKKNNLGAVGAILIAIAAIAVPAYLILAR